MRDGRGNKLSPEEERKVRSIQGAPDKDSLKKVSIKPEPDGSPAHEHGPEDKLGQNRHRAAQNRVIPPL